MKNIRQSILAPLANPLLQLSDINLIFARFEGLKLQINHDLTVQLGSSGLTHDERTAHIDMLNRIVSLDWPDPKDEALRILKSKAGIRLSIMTYKC